MSVILGPHSHARRRTTRVRQSQIRSNETSENARIRVTPREVCRAEMKCMIEKFELIISLKKKVHDEPKNPSIATAGGAQSYC